MSPERQAKAEDVVRGLRREAQCDICGCFEVLWVQQGKLFCATCWAKQLDDRQEMFRLRFQD